MHQISFEDIERSNSLAQQPGRTAFIDECGNPGFNFIDKEVSEVNGSSLYYIVCAVVVNNEDINTLEVEADTIRKKNSFQTGEMKSSSVGKNKGRRAKILTELLMHDFSVIILIADKQQFYKDSALVNYKESFIKYLRKLLYEEMYAVYPKLRIVEDEYGSSEFQSSFREYVRANRPELSLLNEYEFDFVESEYSPIVQIADMIAGSVMHHLLDSTAPDVLKIFKSSIRGIIKFPRPYPSYFAKLDSNEYDKDIFDLANHCANRFIESHRHDDDEETRMRVLFLKHLLLEVRNFNPNRYISSGEVISILSEVYGHRIRRNYLYRKIIAPLRDSGVIIASNSHGNSHGYKIPSCINDINSYVNTTIGVTGPMLKCRKLILQKTNGDLDIFDDPALESYKRYFGDY